MPTDGADAARNPPVDPRAVAVDSTGRVYILERRGNALRVVDAKGKIRTLIGAAHVSSSNSSATRKEAGPKMNGPKHLCVDTKDNVIIADSENHLILKYTPRDERTVVIVGTGEKGSGLVADDPLKTQLQRYSLVRRDALLVVAQDAIWCHGRNLLDRLPPTVNRPHGVYAHPSGALYISDSDNNRVLKMMNRWR